VSVDDTLAAIDAAVGCQQCGRPLGGSVSVDFDTEECQTAWHAARASRLPVPVSIRIDIDSAALEVCLAAIREAHVTYRRDLNGGAFDSLLRAHDTLRTTLQNGDYDAPEVTTAA